VVEIDLKPPILKGLAAIIDIDGTVADCGNRPPLNYDLVSQDRPKPDVIRVVQALTRSGFIHAFWVTGRPERCRPETKAWLERYIGRAPEHLIMRGEKDRRPNQQYKEEVYRTIIEPGWTVVAVFEDNPKAAEMYRRFGLEVFRVFNENYGNIDFN
jgi:hypothetical protein